MRRIAKYLTGLPATGYQIPEPIAAVVDFALDSYFARIEELNSKHRDDSPADPKTHVKELWLGCEIHKATSVNRTYPMFAKAKNAWAFAKLFESGGLYEAVPFLDSYPWKNAVKGSYEYRVQQETIQVGPDKSVTLPVLGTFFVTDAAGAKLIVQIDLGYESPACVVTAVSSPESGAAQKFLDDLDRSMETNDIYFQQCLVFLRGFLGFTQVRPTGWDEIVLKSDVVQEIRENTVGVVGNMDKLAALGMIPSRNVILISPPGMAKTTVFRAISHEMGQITRIWCTGKSVKDSSDVTSLFEAARSLAPCIVFIEDMDLFGRDRGSLSGYESHVLNEFLACLDGMHQNSGVVIMASTNDIQSMDEALVDRPGRFDVKIEMPYPDAADRSQMLASFLKRVHATPDESVSRDTIKTVVDLTDGLTGAYIRELANATVIRAVAAGNLVPGGVKFSADDLNAAAEQVVRNYKIGKAARKKVQAEISVT